MATNDSFVLIGGVNGEGKVRSSVEHPNTERIGADKAK